MDNQTQPEKPEKKSRTAKSPERRGPPLGNNVIWYLLGIWVTILLVVGWLHQDSAYEVQYSQLVALIRASGPGSGEHGIVIHESNKPGSVGVRYRDPSEINIAPYEITGKVIREAPGETTAESGGGTSDSTASSTGHSQPVSFRTDKDPNEFLVQDFLKLCEDSKIPVSFVPGPMPL